ncbi:NAD(P)/FAD-dependent oxidoreductase [Pectinatus frisingensis]|uniref:NAD(P)/FAD-dependent oxidoreductase n=1 Tax=Pectinatus frisingensis TaxID=865 RepID=UPI0015F73B24|nr:hypothetical protein [Pectinatus frisingensis]
MICLTNLNVAIGDVLSLESAAAKRLKISSDSIKKISIARKTLDARRYKNAPIRYVYTLNITLENSLEKKLLHRFFKDKNVNQVVEVPLKVSRPIVDKAAVQPLVVGFGPAGMFCALTLCRFGYRPIILERGRDVDQRHRDIEKFWKSGILDTVSNVQFGEGGAGTFSDGKLTTRIHDTKINQVLEDFISAGAPAEIRYLHKPHIGTDILRVVVKNIRKKIISMGGTVKFSHQLTNLEIIDKRVQSVIVNGKDRVPCSALFLGIGHSARDTYEMLYKNGISMAVKSFAIGVRIEHPQTLIDMAQYGEDAGNPQLPVADYVLTFHDKARQLTCYSFCMCPGGSVIAAASEENRLTTNGMSNYARNSGIANSALLTPVTPADFGNDVLSGIEFQRHYENLAFMVGGGNYSAPVQTVGDFLEHNSGDDKFLTVPTYKPGVCPVDLHNCLPGKVAAALEAALPYFDKKIHGFANRRVVMTGLEMRSSAPCKINRFKDSYLSLNTKGLYPIGEGAGYAGGIMSAAVDGINAALSYITVDKNMTQSAKI